MAGPKFLDTSKLRRISQYPQPLRVWNGGALRYAPSKGLKSWTETYLQAQRKRFQTPILGSIIFDQGIFPIRTSPIRPTVWRGHPVIALCKPKPVVSIFAIRTRQTQKISNAVCLIELYFRGKFNISPPTYCAIECAGLHGCRQPIQRGATLWRGAHAAASRQPCGGPLDLANPVLSVRDTPLGLSVKKSIASMPLHCKNNSVGSVPLHCIALVFYRVEGVGRP